MSNDSPTSFVVDVQWIDNEIAALDRQVLDFQATIYRVQGAINALRETKKYFLEVKPAQDQAPPEEELVSIPFEAVESD